MVYFIVYAIFAYLIMMGEVFGEVALNVKPNRTQFVFFVLAPLTFPIFLGYWMAQVMNLNARQETVTQEKVKVKNVKP
jgi:hypothetical protein